MSIRKFALYFTLTCIVISQIQGQSLEAGYGQFGTMLYWKGKIPNAERIEIRRTPEAESIETVSWPIHRATTVDQFLHNAAVMPPIFRNLFPFTEKSAGFYIEKLNTGTSLESIPALQTPNVLFALGRPR